MRGTWIVMVLGWTLLGPAAYAGGVSGGGGNTTPANRATPEQVVDALRGARMEAALYFQGMQELVNAPSKWTPRQIRLFGGPRTIVDVIRETAISPEADRACHYRGGPETDGSTEGSSPHSICISVLRLAQKLTRSDYFAQTVALVAHEYSHFVGFDETEATALQEEMLGAISPLGNGAGDRWLIDRQARVSSLSVDMLTVKNLREQYSWEALRETGFRWMREIADMNAPTSDLPFEVNNPQQHGLAWGAMGKTNVLAVSTGALSSDPKTAKEFDDLLRYFYGGGEVIRLKAALVPDPTRDDRWYPDWVAHRVRTKAIFASEVDDIRAWIGEYARYLDSFRQAMSGLGTAAASR